MNFNCSTAKLNILAESQNNVTGNGNSNGSICRSEDIHDRSYGIRRCKVIVNSTFIAVTRKILDTAVIERDKIVRIRSKIICRIDGQRLVGD